jgi:hypothetical protein
MMAQQGHAAYKIYTELGYPRERTIAFLKETGYHSSAKKGSGHGKRSALLVKSNEKGTKELMEVPINQALKKIKVSSDELSEDLSARLYERIKEGLELLDPKSMNDKDLLSLVNRYMDQLITIKKLNTQTVNHNVKLVGLIKNADRL